MNNSNNKVFKQANASGSGQRSRTLDYKHLSAYGAKSCMVYTLDIPDIQSSDIVPVFNTRDRAAQFFHTTERKEIVTFRVVYTPFNNSDGHALLKQAKELVDSVLTSKFEPETATINILRNGKTEKTIRVDDTVIVGAEIMIDLHDFVRVGFTLSGILASS